MSSIRTQARGELSRTQCDPPLSLRHAAGPPRSFRAAEQPSIAEQIAKAYGLGSGGKRVETLRYTWNIELPGGKTIFQQVGMEPEDQHRLLRWQGHGGQFGQGHLSTLAARQPKRRREEGGRSAIRPIDQYWTLLPFHLLWDGAAPTDDGQQKLPIGDGTAQRIAMKYPSEGGYQPGDTWDLYIGPDKRIVQITYHRGAPNPPHLVSAKYTRTTRRLARFCSQSIIAGLRTGSPSTFGFRMCRLS